MSRHYIPFKLKVCNGITAIVYPAKDEMPLKSIIHRIDLENHIKKVYDNNAQLINESLYLIIFAWRFDREVALDIWKFFENSHSNSGPLVGYIGSVGERIVENTDIASGDTLYVLGKEDEKRREFKTIEEYLNSSLLPSFKSTLAPNESF